MRRSALIQGWFAIAVSGSEKGMEQATEQRKPFASGGPAGLVTLAFYISFLWPLSTGLVDPAYAPALIPLGISVAIAQIASGVIELRNGHILEGTIPLAFSCFMALGAGEAALALAGSLPEGTGAIDGHIMLVMGLFMSFLLIHAVREPLMVCMFYLMNACFFSLAGVSRLADLPALNTVANTFMLLVAVTAFWCGMAQLLETSDGRPVLWMGRPLLRKSCK